jgi:hypothetical protein
LKKKGRKLLQCLLQFGAYLLQCRAGIGGRGWAKALNALENNTKRGGNHAHP